MKLYSVKIFDGGLSFLIIINYTDIYPFLKGYGPRVGVKTVYCKGFSSSFVNLEDKRIEIEPRDCGKWFDFAIS